MKPPSTRPLLSFPRYPSSGGCLRGDLERFAARMHERSFLAGASVFTAEQPGEAVYVLLRGAVKVHTSLPDGN